MIAHRLILHPLWWETESGRLNNFESEIALLPGDRELLAQWSSPRSVEDVAASIGLPAAQVEEAAERLLAHSVLAVEADIRYKVLGIELEITGACQADCGFCPREAVRVSRGFAHMSQEVFDQVLENVGGRGVLNYSLCGIGEPLLHPRWLEFSRAIRQRDLHATIYCRTNGWDLGGRTGQLLAESPIDVVTVSVHSYDQDVRRRIMRLKGKDDVLAEIDRFLQILKTAGSTLKVKIIQVELPDLPRDEALAQWAAARGLPFDSTSLWNRAGNAMVPDTPTNWTNPSPDSCYHYATGLFIDHRGTVLACCCDAQSQTGFLSARTSTLEEIAAKRLERLASGEPLTPLCLGCDTPLSNRPVLATKFYPLALARQR